MGRNRARDGNFSALRCPKDTDDYLTFLLQRKWIRQVPKTKFEKTSLERWQKSWFMKNIQAMERFHCLWIMGILFFFVVHLLYIWTFEGLSNMPPKLHDSAL